MNSACDTTCESSGVKDVSALRSTACASTQTQTRLALRASSGAVMQANKPPRHQRPSTLKEAGPGEDSIRFAPSGGGSNSEVATVSRTSTKHKRSKTAEIANMIWRFLEHPDNRPMCKAFHVSWGILITISVAGAIGADMALPLVMTKILAVFEVVCTTLFTTELLVKLVVCPHRVPFLKSMYTVIDIIVICQGFMKQFLRTDRSPFLSLVSTLSPILRLLKIARHSSGWHLLLISMRRCREPLLIPLYLMMLMVTFSGSLLYWVEINLPDEGVDPVFISIPHAMWFTVVTISTVGYGDIYPKSDAGKVVGAFLIVAGVGYLAMPLAIIGQQFGDVWKERRLLMVLEKMKKFMGGVIDVEMLEAMFHEYDSGNGEISFNQFEEVVESLQMGLTRRDVREIFSAVDADGSGAICFPEFEEFITADRDSS